MLKFKIGHGHGETEFAKIDGSQGDALKCPSCGHYISSLRWLPPFRAELELWDPTYGDIAFGAGPELIVSERFKMLWSQSGLVALAGFNSVHIVRALHVS